MKSYYNLNISEPCSEDFKSFSKTKKGGFCDLCEKEVIDFTKMTSAQITNYMNRNKNKNICGRFKQQQLQLTRVQNQKRSLLNTFSGFGLALLALFSFKTAYAQGKLKIDDNANKDKTRILDTLSQKTITVKGTVITSSDDLPLPGANVILQGTSIGTQTDFDGNFQFPKQLKKGDVLVFSYVGMKTQKVVIQDEKTSFNIELKVDMDSCELMLVGKVSTKEVYNSKPKN